MIVDLLEEIERAEAETVNGQDHRQCDACAFIDDIEDEATQNAVKLALSGTIGIRKLVGILRGHGATFGRRTIERHRREEH